MAWLIFPIVLLVGGLLLQFQLQRQRILGDTYCFRCDNCGSKFDLPPLAATLAPHRAVGKKFVRCPSCGTRSWVSRVPK
jgi:DNA-directed RNA polymerase subunit RPC12/RpoP